MVSEDADEGSRCWGEPGAPTADTGHAPHATPTCIPSIAIDMPHARIGNTRTTHVRGGTRGTARLESPARMPPARPRLRQRLQTLYVSSTDPTQCAQACCQHHSNVTRICHGSTRPRLRVRSMRTEQGRQEAGRSKGAKARSARAGHGARATLIIRHPGRQTEPHAQAPSRSAQTRGQASRPLENLRVL